MDTAKICSFTSHLHDMQYILAAEMDGIGSKIMNMSMKTMKTSQGADIS